MSGYTVVGLTEGEIRRWGGPVHRLKDCLVEQLAKVHQDVFPVDAVIVYAVNVNGGNSAALDKLCDQLPNCKGFAQLLFLNHTASQACDKFGIPIAALGTVRQDDIPPERTVVLERPFFPGL